MRKVRGEELEARASVSVWGRESMCVCRQLGPLRSLCRNFVKGFVDGAD